MRWGSKKQQPGTPPPCAPERGADTPARKSNGKAFPFSFSPLSWLAKLATKPKTGTKRASAHEDGGGATPAFPSSCLPERASPANVAIAPAGRPGSPVKFVARRLSVGNDNADAVTARGRHRSPANAAEEEAVPRRLSVGVDNADAVPARRRCTLQRHRSFGGDRDDIHTPLGHLIPFSLAASPAPPPPPQPAPSDTDAGSARPQRRRRRGHRHRRSLSGGRRSSFSGRVTLRVKVRSSRRAGPELESLAVVRRTRDPQRAFRESMSEMIATSGGRPEELERLLSCYLALNADEHHGCIVKVFRQVLFDHVNGRPAAAEPAGTLRPPRAAADAN
uniref:Uncharacterized protein n=1 Tax=Avena sativa TaxID=4498 RepID=A0ACD5T8H8_AVESA